MNANEPWMRLRDVGLAERLKRLCMQQWSPWADKSRERIPSSRSKEGTPHRLVLTHAEQDNPNEVSESVDTLSKPPARKAEFFSGEGKDQNTRSPWKNGRYPRPLHPLESQTSKKGLHPQSQQQVKAARNPRRF